MLSGFKFDTSSLRQILIAAAPVATTKLKQGVAIFGPVVAQCYGQAEAPMLISMLSAEDIADSIKRQLESACKLWTGYRLYRCCNTR